jgi:hypothetical protein
METETYPLRAQVADALGAFFCLAVFWAAMAVLAC